MPFNREGVVDGVAANDEGSDEKQPAIGRYGKQRTGCRQRAAGIGLARRVRRHDAGRESAIARNSAELAMMMQDRPKRSTSWPDNSVPATKAADPVPRTQP